MKITKLVHSCLLVETPERTVLFDPGVFSAEMVRATDIQKLDAIYITHQHADHMDVKLIAELKSKFPNATIVAPRDAFPELQQSGITASEDPDGFTTLFQSPHEVIAPFYDAAPPQELGFHYLDTLSVPGDSHSFTETKKVLALPVQAPWGTPVDALALALKLRPEVIIPVHDWHWSEAARASSYDQFEQVCAAQSIRFIKTVNGEAFEVEI